MENYYSAADIADRLGVSTLTVRRWIESGKLRAVKVARNVRVPESALRALLDASAVAPKATAASEG